MNRLLALIGFALGLTAVGWVAAGYLGANPLALTVTLLIAAFYLAGALELRRFSRATAALEAALAALPQPLPVLGDWLDTVPPVLRHPVRLRIEGERVALPAPSIAPYLVGLLVLLGMLGTFLGMVVTLNGAVRALQGTADLPTLRAALAAPVEGLGLAFGTSVAGVAASAMLGLVLALCRRDRLHAVQALDLQIATTLRPFSLAHRREQTLTALQLQARLLPELVDRVQAMTEQIALRSDALNERLLAGQERFHSHTGAAYRGLASAVDRALQQSLTDSAERATATIRPVVEATLAGIAKETAAVQAMLADSTRRQLDGIAGRFDAAVTTVADTWTRALADHQRSSDALAGGLEQSLGRFSATFAQRSDALLADIGRAHARQQAAAAELDQQRLGAWSGELQAIATALAGESQRTAAAALDRQQQICSTLQHTAEAVHARAEAHAQATFGEIARLIEVASAAPRAAAEAVDLLRRQIADSVVRDNQSLDERGRIMERLGALLDASSLAADRQRASSDALLQSATTVLQQAGTRFDATVDAQAAQLGTAAAQLAASAVDVASIGDAFGGAVQRFGESNAALIAQLQRIEAALGESAARSDEQLAYYVAQAREIVDLSIGSQRQIVEDLQRIAGRREPALAGESA